ncbi:MAG: SDR family oxidoreductase [Chitinophagaceae bacterium]|nr:MAG: SDR family oxidoreductase [Chitinophagaceae bacterium]
MNIVITGATKGIGKAIAEAFAEDKQGHTFYLCARNETSLQVIGKELQGRFPRTNIFTRVCDMSERESVAAFAAWILQAADKIDVLVNNAGIFIPGSVEQEEEGSLEKMMAVNLFGSYHLTRALIPVMKKNNSGHIFNICSIASLKAYSNGGAYSISKFAFYGFSQNLREEMKPYGIKVTSVLPGAVLTDSWSGFDNSSKRIMEASDIAKLVYAASFLSPQACVEEILVRPQLGDL